MSFGNDVEGLSYLCFFDSGSWFQSTMDQEPHAKKKGANLTLQVQITHPTQGIILTKDRKQYGVMGETCDPPEGGFAECCFEDAPMFYKITVIDHETNEEVVFEHVMKTGGDNCTLMSDELDFETEELLVGSKAESHVMKYCRPELRGLESIVCAGHMMLHHTDQRD